MQNTYGQTAQDMLLLLGQDFDWGQSLSSPKGTSQANPTPYTSTATELTPTLEQANSLSLITHETNPLVQAEDSSQQVGVKNAIPDPALPRPKRADGSQHLPETSRSPTKPYMKDCIHQLSDLCLNLYECSQSWYPDTTAFGSLSKDFSIPSSTVSSCKGSSTGNNMHGFQGVVGADAAFNASQDFIQILQSSSANTNVPATTSPEFSGYGTPFSPPSHQGKRMSVDTDPWLGRAFPSASSSSSNFAHAADSAPHDGTAILLTLTCYLRLLHMYEPLVRSILRQQQQLRSSDIHHMVDVRVGNFSASSSSELRIVLLVQIISHLLNRIEGAIRRRLSATAHSQHREHTSSTQHFRPTTSHGGGHGRNFSASSTSTYVNGLSQNSSSDSPMTTEMAGNAFGAVLDEMGNLESNIRKDLDSLKSLLQDSLMV